MDYEAFSVHILCASRLFGLLRPMKESLPVHNKFKMYVSHHTTQTLTNGHRFTADCSAILIAKLAPWDTTSVQPEHNISEIKKLLGPSNGTKLWSHSRGFELSYRDASTICTSSTYSMLTFSDSLDIFLCRQ